MKIISYNVNGIRAAIKKGFIEWLSQTNPDVICLQEVKALEEQVDLEEVKKMGYQVFWNAADKKGYSGVAIFSKIPPKSVESDTGVAHLDGEGRVIRADFEDFSVISLYLPSGTNIDRLDFKLQFCDEFSNYIHDLEKKYNKLIICGDYNICHEAIDIHDPVRLKNVSGFLPVEREWMTHYMNYCNLVDAFREFNDQPGQYTWWSYRANAKQNNKGWRIDYHMVTENLKSKLKRSVILPEINFSDHCPILLEVE
ncbi:exodeoxyribonuclease III [Ornithobacterium rhinotracheale]|uniref:Exodeoxyribonuclease III n=1 Tax=Ornithobacterium rhinotracheale TaxID=28251 RepID=A0A3R5Y4Q8_ORNRH|nr:exodeoxyribonuclease III [Ornithobacterium rhinotracheale]QAR31693.1 exodeoxyribonuclease III [Ornithobacterium rhinotracheale]